MEKQNLGKSIGKGKIPEERWDWIISKLGESFKSPLHALRQYIDNAKDANNIKIKYGNGKEETKLIIIKLNRKEKSIRIIDNGPGILSEKPVFENPSKKKVTDEQGEPIPYINSFTDMKNNIGNSIKKFVGHQTGENATGMLAFIKLGCKNIKFISQINGKIKTYTITKNNEFFISEKGEKSYGGEGVEILLEGINGKIFNNHFDSKRLELELRKIYHEDLLNGNAKINLIYDSTKKIHSKGRRKKEPFIQLKPLEITGDEFEISQIKTKLGNKIFLNLKLKNSPQEDLFITLNCRGTGGVPMKDITYNPIWNSNKYICGFIEADFLHFAGNDKSNFQDDEELNDFIETIEEKIEPKLIEAINKIKSKGEKEKINKMVENIKNALSKTLKDLGINPWGEGERKKKCPSCEKEHPYNQQVCHECGYEWPTSTKTCKFCNKNIPSASKICPECKKNLIELINCSGCGKNIPKLSFTCPECGLEIRKPLEKQKGKSPQIDFVPLGVNNSRSSIDKNDKGIITNILINTDHENWTQSKNKDSTQIYVAMLTSKEIAKYQFGEEKPDYSEDITEIWLGIFNSLRNNGSIKYNEGIN